MGVVVGDGVAGDGGGWWCERDSRRGGGVVSIVVSLNDWVCTVYTA
jgi:hypothetical protein